MYSHKNDTVTLAFKGKCPFYAYSSSMRYLDVNMDKFKKNNSLLYCIAQPLCPAMGSVVLIHLFFLTCGVGFKKRKQRPQITRDEYFLMLSG